MKVTDLDAGLSNPIPFRLSESLSAPEQSGCYVLSNIYNDVLYVGQTSDLRRRMEQHLADDRMTDRTSLGLASWFSWRLVDSSELRSLEDRLLFRFKAAEGRLPLLNRVGP